MCCAMCHNSAQAQFATGEAQEPRTNANALAASRICIMRFLPDMAQQVITSHEPLADQSVVCVL